MGPGGFYRSHPRAGSPPNPVRSGLVVTGSSHEWMPGLTSPLCPVMGCSYDAAASDGKGSNGYVPASGQWPIAVARRRSLHMQPNSQPERAGSQSLIPGPTKPTSQADCVRSHPQPPDSPARGSGDSGGMTASGQSTQPSVHCPVPHRRCITLLPSSLSSSPSLFKTTQEQHTHHTQSKTSLPPSPTTLPNLLTSAHDYFALTAAINQHVYHH